MPFKTHEIEVEDVEYLRHGSKPLLARLFKPRGSGPFPALVDVHGGAWNLSDRLADTMINEALAKSGVVVAALDFRMPPEASYPASMADINYGVRWLKVHAYEFGSRAELVGIEVQVVGIRRCSLRCARVTPGMRQLRCPREPQRSMRAFVAPSCIGPSSIPSGAIITLKN
jgi:hypothetical protein